MNRESTLNEKQGHWILAKLGKKVLRPGGRELTETLIRKMNIQPSDDVVEFAPGLGFTVNITCSHQPNSYTGVDINKEATKLARKSIKYSKAKVIISDVSQTTLLSGCATKVYGEAMLTMQTLENKKAIIKEAFRLLKPGGYYGIHELGIRPDEVDESVKKEIFKGLSSNIRVHARPMTTAEWVELLTEQGFSIVSIDHNPMHLLEGKRVLQDEGFWRTMKFLFNLLRFPDLRKRVLNMRSVFREYDNHLDAVAIVAQKPLT